MKLSRPYYLCKSDRVVVLFLLAVLAFGVIGYHLLWPSADTTPIAAADSTRSKRRALDTDSRRAYTYATPSRQVVYAPFDPNTADSTQLLSLGLQPYQVRNIYHYRAKGGVYRRPSDFARLYGLTAKQYRELEPYIRISADYLPASEVYAVHDERPKASSDSLRYPVKLRNSERVALNLADTTLLRRVPGIGAYYARRIVAYRQRLGGYAHARQLLEIDDFPEEALPFFTVDAGDIQRLDINRLSLSQLKRHPYINYLQARAICDYRRLKGPLASLDQLRLLSAFTAADIERLRPYVRF